MASVKRTVAIVVELYNIPQHSNDSRDSGEWKMNIWPSLQLGHWSIGGAWSGQAQQQEPATRELEPPKRRN